MAAAVSVPIREISRAVESFESPATRRQNAKSLKLLTHEERSELLLEWGGYESACPVRSAFGAILDAALRAPPRDVWRLVVDELQRRGGRAPIDNLVRVIKVEGLATDHEVRLAVRAMCGAGQVVKYVQDMPAKNHKDEQVIVPTEMVKLGTIEPWRIPDEVAPEERWRRADAELERFCVGEVPCHETRHSSFVREPDTMSTAEAQPVPRAGKLSGLDRSIIERVYGSSFHPPYIAEFGRELAAVLEYTAIVASQREALSQPHRAATVAEALRSVLDDAPDDLRAQVAWRAERQRFIAVASGQARKLLEGAVAALRQCRGW